MTSDEIKNLETALRRIHETCCVGDFREPPEQQHPCTRMPVWVVSAALKALAELKGLREELRVERRGHWAEDKDE